MEPIIASTGRDSAHIVRLRLIQGIALLVLIVSLCLFALRPDIEQIMDRILGRYSSGQ